MNKDDFATFGGSLTADVLNFNPDAIPKPDTLFIRMTRGERKITDELRKQFGGFRRVAIDVDGEKHEFNADSLIRLLESYEGGETRFEKLFGTPERAAETLAKQCFGSDWEACAYCVNRDCDESLRKSGSFPFVKGELLEWLKQEVDE